MKKILQHILLLQFFLPLVVFAQLYQVKYYSVESGIASNYVFDIAQDQQGNMWFATEIGASKYDGSVWTNYGEKQGVKSLQYVKIKIDPFQNVWLIPLHSARSPIFFNGEKWQSLPPLPKEFGIEKLDTQEFSSLDFLVDNGKLILCIGSNSGLYIYQNSKWKWISTKEGLPDNLIYNIKTYNNKLYICTEKGLSIYNGKTIDSSINKLFNPSSDAVYAIDFESKEVDSNSNVFFIWLLGKNWIGSIDNNNNFKKLTNKNLLRVSPFGNRFHLVYDRVGRLYYGTLLERFFIDKESQKIHPFGLENGLTSDGSSAVFFDKEMNLWMSYYRGIDKISNHRFQHYNRFTGLAEDEVTAILELKPGTLLLGHNNSLSYLQNKVYNTIDLSKYKTSIGLYTRILDMCKDRIGNIWIAGSFRGIIKLDANGRLKFYQKKIIEQFSAVICDNDGVIWTTSNKGLYKINGDSLELAQSIKEKNIIIRKLLIDKDSKIYATSSNGIHVFQYGKLLNSIKSLGPTNSTFCIFAKDEKTKWIGTADGLYELKGNKLVKVKLGNYFLNLKVFFITKDKSNNIWFGTNDGIHKWNGKVLKQYSIESGLLGRETNRSAYLVDYYGKLWVGTDKGLSSYLNEYDLPEKPPIINALIAEDFEGKKYNLNNYTDLSYNQRTINFLFRASSFKDENKIMYRIKLSGFDKDWIDVGLNNSIRYTNLPSGEYVFHVQAKNSTTEWSPTFSSKLIQVNPPFYFRFWFIVLTIVSSALITIIFINYFIQKKYNTRLKKEVQEKYQEIKDFEAKISTLIQNAHSIITTIDKTGKILFTNRAIAKYEVQELLGKDILDLIPREKHELIKDLLKQVFEEQKSIEFENKYTDKDHQSNWLLSYVSPIVINSKVSEAFIITIDISEKKRAALARQEIELRQKAVIDALKIVLVTGTVPNKFDASWMTDNVESLTGFPKENFIQIENFWSERLHIDDKERIVTGFKNLLNNVSVSFEYRWLHSDGKYRWFLDYAVPRGEVKNNSIEYFSIWLDITEKKRSQFRLEKLNICLLSLGSNPNENINKLVELVGEELGASTAIYLFLKENILYSKGSWGLPKDYQPHYIAQGQMSYDMIASKNKEGVYIKDLFNTKYYESDPDVKKYGMKSYFGFPVRFEEQIKGCICVTYNQEYEPTFEDQKFVGIISSALAVEEERNLAMELLKNSVAEKDVLLKEVYHRVKNNLQVISSLLYLQSTQITDDALLNMFKESQNRVKSMALVHEKLYQSKDLARVSVSEYINSLVVYLLSSYNVEGRIDITVNVQDFLLDVDKIIPCGLIINELISNAIKYAFPNNYLIETDPRVNVVFEQKDGVLSLAISDNGIGLPENYNFDDNDGSLGIKLVKLLTMQIEGNIKYSFDGGSKFEIIFPFT